MGSGSRFLLRASMLFAFVAVGNVGGSLFDLLSNAIPSQVPNNSIGGGLGTDSPAPLPASASQSIDAEKEKPNIIQFQQAAPNVAPAVLEAPLPPPHSPQPPQPKMGAGQVMMNSRPAQQKPAQHHLPVKNITQNQVFGNVPPPPPMNVMTQPGPGIRMGAPSGGIMQQGGMQSQFHSRSVSFPSQQQQEQPTINVGNDPNNSAPNSTQVHEQQARSSVDSFQQQQQQVGKNASDPNLPSGQVVASDAVRSLPDPALSMQNPSNTSQANNAKAPLETRSAPTDPAAANTATNATQQSNEGLGQRSVPEQLEPAGQLANNRTSDLNNRTQNARETHLEPSASPALPIPNPEKMAMPIGQQQPPAIDVNAGGDVNNSSRPISPKFDGMV